MDTQTVRDYHKAPRGTKIEQCRWEWFKGTKVSTWQECGREDRDTGVDRFAIQTFELALPNNSAALVVRIPQALVSPLTQLFRERQIGDCSEVLGQGFGLCRESVGRL